MNPILELKKRFAPRSRWGAVELGPRREFGSLTWSEPEERGQPQDGALMDSDYGDEPQVSPLPKVNVLAKIEVASVTAESALRKPVLALLR